MHACLHTCVHTHVCTYIHTDLHTCIHTYLHAYLRNTYIHARMDTTTVPQSLPHISFMHYIRIYTPTLLLTDVSLSIFFSLSYSLIHTYLCIYLYTYIPYFLLTRLCIPTLPSPSHLHLYCLRTHTYIYLIPAYALRTHLPSCLHDSMLTSIPTAIPTSLRTRILLYLSVLYLYT